MASSTVASENAGLRPGSSERSKLRRDRLRQIEMEQLVEEKQALKMTEVRVYSRYTRCALYSSVLCAGNYGYPQTVYCRCPLSRCSFLLDSRLLFVRISDVLFLG